MYTATRPGYRAAAQPSAPTMMVPNMPWLKVLVYGGAIVVIALGVLLALGG